MTKKLLLLPSLIFIHFSLFAQEELCPPVALNVFGGDQENIISWGEPVGNIGCGDFPIDELPYSHQYTNAGNGDNWPVSGSNGEDVAYTLNVSQATTFDFTLCNDATDYDCKLEIFTNDQDCITPTTTGNYNDDDYSGNCPYGSYNAPYPPSGLFGVTLQPGQYYVVVDGYGGATGNYELSVSVSGGREHYNPIDNSIRTVWPSEIIKMEELGVSQEEIESYSEIVNNPMRYARLQQSSRDIPVECGSFTTYRIYNAADDAVIASTIDLSYTHSELTNGEEYCYYIKTIYGEGESEPTETMCGTPSDFDPAKPTNVYAEVWDEEVSIYWTEPSVLELGVPYYEGFDDGGLLDLWLVDGDNWFWNDFSGSPEPCFQFNWNPTSLDYDQSLYAPAVPLGDLTTATLSFDFEFNNFDTTGAEFLSIEYKTGGQTDWTSLQEFNNSGASFEFTSYSYDIEGLTDNIQVRFHCYGATTYDINWYYIDNFAITSNERDSRLEYDFLGYNVYLDGVLDNAEIFDTTGYTIYNLSNEIEYEFGVSSVYEGAEGEDNYESVPVTVNAQPIYVFGDVTGTITDPNDAPIDSVIVSSGSVSDTTGSDGVYTLWNLDVGSNTITARRSGFYTSSLDADVLAQADPTLLNLELSPDMPSPAALNAYPLDEQVFLQWRTPGSVAEYDIAYYDDVFEAQIGCGGSCQFGVRFTPPNYPTTLTGLVLSFQDGAAVGAGVDVYLDPDGAVNGPVGEPINLIPSADLSAPDGLVQYQFDVSGSEVEISSGDIYIVVTENNSGFLGIANDIEPQSEEYYDRNWVSTGYEFTTIYDIVGGDPSLTGDFGILAQFLGVPGRTYTMTASGDVIDDALISNGDFSNYNLNEIESNNSEVENPENITELSELYIPTNPSLTNVDRDDIMYYVVTGEDNLPLATPTDTFVTVDASPNYELYCYKVTAVWQTDNYGILESRPSNVACTVPYTSGDADFDSDVDIADVLSVVDFALELDIPTEDEFRNCDVNNDEEINITDIILMVDVIFGANARMLSFDPNEIAYVDLLNDYDESELLVNIDYNSLVRGLEFELLYNPGLISINSPSLSDNQDNVMLNYSEIEPGKLKVIVANLSGGHIVSNDQNYLSVPVTFIGGERDIANISISNINIAGADGKLVNFIGRTTSLTLQVIPTEFALHQNFPNPFNPITEIQFDLPEESAVSLDIYNLMGQNIRTLASETYSPGFHSIVWDGTNDYGEQVATGMYFYSIQTNLSQATKKMLFLK